MDTFDDRQLALDVIGQGLTGQERPGRLVFSASSPSRSFSSAGRRKVKVALSVMGLSVGCMLMCTF